MTLAYFLGLVLCILFATEITGNFFFEKTNKAVIATQLLVDKFIDPIMALKKKATT